jgi:CRISPR-associated protein Csc3
MNEQNELLIKLFADDADDLALIFLEELLNRGLNTLPDIIQTGAKQGQSLRAHLQNVLCWAYQFSRFFQLKPEDIVNLLAACLVHDINKFPEFQKKSYSNVATVENVQKIFDPILNECEYHYNMDWNLIVSLIRASSQHHHCDGDSLYASANNDYKRNVLIKILRTADILDLSHNFYEIHQKNKALNELNVIADDCQFQFTWHYFSDNRGIFTNLIHNVIIDLYCQHGALPIMFYPHGVWYIVKKNYKINIQPEQIALQIENKMNKMSADDPLKLLKYAKVGFKYTQNPFKVGFTPSQVLDYIVASIIARSDSKFNKKYDELSTTGKDKIIAEYNKWMSRSDRRQKELKKIEKKYQELLKKLHLPLNVSLKDEKVKALPPQKRRDLQNALQKLKNARADAYLETIFPTKQDIEKRLDNLFVPDMEALRAGDLVSSFALLLSNHLDFSSDKAWQLAAEIPGLDCSLYPELQFFSTQSNRGYRLGALLYQQEIGFEEIQRSYTVWLDEYLEKYSDRFNFEASDELIEYIKMNLRTSEQTLTINDDILKHYVKEQHKHCCHCGSPQAKELMSGDLPGLKVQLFSNRLSAGGGEPKRKACTICKLSFVTEKIINISYAHHYYLHLFADGGDYSSHAMPEPFIAALKQTLQELQQTDFRSFFIVPDNILKQFLDGTPEAQIKITGSSKGRNGMIIPRFPVNVSGQITLGINPPEGQNESNGFVFALFYLLFLTRHFHLRGILTKSAIPLLEPDEIGKIYIDNIPVDFKALISDNNLNASQVESLWQSYVALYGLRNTYSYKDNEIVKLAKTLFDSSGLELFYYLKNEYNKKQGAKDTGPWTRAWPYLQIFINKEELMPIKELASIALENHFHGKSWRDTSRAKPLDLVFRSLGKHMPYETEDDLKMIVLHDLTRGLERIFAYPSLGQEKYDAVKKFVNVFFEKLYRARYKGDKNKIMRDQKRIRAAFLGYLTILNDEKKISDKQDN